MLCTDQSSAWDISGLGLYFVPEGPVRSAPEAVFLLQGKVEYLSQRRDYDSGQLGSVGTG